MRAAAEPTEPASKFAKSYAIAKTPVFDFAELVIDCWESDRDFYQERNRKLHEELAEGDRPATIRIERVNYEFDELRIG